MKKLLLFAALCAALVACNKNIDQTPRYKAGETITLSARIDNHQTKITSNNIDAAEVTFKWQEGDQVLLILFDSSTQELLEAQVFTVKSGTISTDGKSADFTGKALGNMSSYTVYFLGRNADVETISGFRSGNVSLDNVSSNYNLVIEGTGNEEGFSLNTYNMALHLKLKGSAKLGKVDYLSGESRVTINCGDGLQLESDSAKDLLIPFYYLINNSFILRFYDTDSRLLLEKVKNEINTGTSNILSFPVLEINAIPEGALSGVFSVGSTKKVRFSKGNLYYNGSTWNFEDNQSDYRTYQGCHSCKNGTKTDTGTASNHWGLFSWAVSNIYGMTTSKNLSDFENYNFEFGDNPIVNGGNVAKAWRRLTKNEWKYLMNTSNATSNARTQANRFAKAKVNGVNGLLIFPDGYSGTVAGGGIGSINETGTEAFPTSSIESSTWTKMENDGCVFLPAAGDRDGANVKNVETAGFYQSSDSEVDHKRYFLYFDIEKVNDVECNYRCYGQSVRLVRVTQ